MQHEEKRLNQKIRIKNSKRRKKRGLKRKWKRKKSPARSKKRWGQHRNTYIHVERNWNNDWYHNTNLFEIDYLIFSSHLRRIWQKTSWWSNCGTKDPRMCILEPRCIQYNTQLLVNNIQIKLEGDKYIDLWQLDKGNRLRAVCCHWFTSERSDYMTDVHGLAITFFAFLV